MDIKKCTLRWCTLNLTPKSVVTCTKSNYASAALRTWTCVTNTVYVDNQLS